MDLSVEESIKISNLKRGVTFHDIAMYHKAKTGSSLTLMSQYLSPESGRYIFTTFEEGAVARAGESKLPYRCIVITVTWHGIKISTPVTASHKASVDAKFQDEIGRSISRDKILTSHDDFFGIPTSNEAS